MIGLKRILLISLPIFLIDQLTKWLVVEWADLKRIGAIDVFDPFLNFRMAWNQGVNFGILNLGDDGGQWVLVALSVVLTLAILFWLRHAALWRIALSGGLIVGGAIGNVVDRVQYGAVADFLNMSCCGFHNPFSFNVADIAIFAGVAGLLIFGDGKDQPGQRKVQSDGET